MARYSHQFLIAVTVESAEKAPDRVKEQELLDALDRRMEDILKHDGREAFMHNDTEEF